MKKVTLTLILVFLICIDIYSQALARKGWLGAKVENVNDSIATVLKLPLNKGVNIIQVVGGTSQKLGLKVNDVITAIENQPVTNLVELSKVLSQLIENQSVIFQLIRDGKPIKLKGKVVGRARESSKIVEVIYESVPYKEGKLSAIISKPKKSGKLPAVLFVPGYTCSSIDNLPDYHPYKRIIDAYTDGGYVVMRIEKSGLGDSQKTPDCSTTTLLDEVESFGLGLQKLMSLSYVDSSNVFIFGHSMGGIVAPALSAKTKVKGVIVYGTTAKSWFEYQLEMNRLQLKLAKVEPLEYEQNCRLQAEIAYEYFILNKSLSDIAKDKEKAEALKRDWQFDGNNMIFDRNQEYWRQIQNYPLLENWKQTTSHVLVLYGQADFQAFSKPDHEQIVDTVNFFHPNQATLIEFPETDHYFSKSGSMQNAFDLFNAGKYAELFENFNVEVTQKTIDWSNQLIK